MTEIEKLERIKAKCHELLANDDLRGLYARAGWRSTIALAELLQEVVAATGTMNPLCRKTLTGILIAWPEEQL